MAFPDFSVLLPGGSAFFYDVITDRMIMHKPDNSEFSLITAEQIGTNGSTIPLNNGNNIFSGINEFNSGGLITTLNFGYSSAVGGYAELLFKASANNRWGFGSVGLSNTFYIYQYKNAANAAVNKYRMLINDSGYVGIGTSSPTQLLHLYTGAASSDTPKIRLENVDAGGPIFDIDVSDNGDFRISKDLSGNQEFVIDGPTGFVGLNTVTPLGSLHVIGATGGSNELILESKSGNPDILFKGTTSHRGQIYASDGNIHLQYASGGEGGTLTNGLYIGNTGNIGIGTSAPEAKLHGVVENTVTSALFSRHDSTLGGAHAQLRKSRGTATTPSAVIANDYTGTISFLGYDGSTYDYTGIIRSKVDSISAGNITSSMIFDTSNAGTFSTTVTFGPTGQIRAGPNLAYVPTISMIAHSSSAQTIADALTIANLWATDISGVGTTHSAGVFTLNPKRMYLVTVMLGWDVTAGAARGEIYGEVQANLDSAGYVLANGGKIFGYERLVGTGSLGSGACQAIIDATAATTSVLLKVMVQRLAAGGDTVDLQANACSIRIDEVKY